MRIDSHHHLWDLSRHPQEWMSGSEHDAVRRDFSMEQFREHAAGTGISKTILVQTVMNFSETPDLLAIAGSDSMIVGVVGFLKMDSSEAITKLENYQNHESARKLVAIRDMAHFYDDDEYLEKAAVIANCRVLGELGFTFDLLTKTEQLKSAIKLVQSCPETHFVLDHISKPLIAEQIVEPWATLIKELSEMSNVSCKVSGMVTEANWKRWKTSDFKPYFEVILESFTPNRLMFGSDWPVALLSGSYSDVINLAEELTLNFTETEKIDFWSGVAIKAYKLKDF